ncbi:MAG: divergent polysaccharide deacetylase family protein [Spirochaetaceae bacterium]|jgi:polysaccharide deacetylase 2 family uncharacterized protein YibQ|nr:divergent polysaccharide deacetylase family protein [Spirochaetaceae bacterium]
MVKKSSRRRTPAAEKPVSGRKKPVKKPVQRKRPGKLTPEDGIRAALIAAILIFAVTLVCTILILIFSFNGDKPANTDESAAGEGTPPGQAPAEVVSRPIPVQPEGTGVPLRQAPPEPAPKQPVPSPATPAEKPLRTNALRPDPAPSRPAPEQQPANPAGSLGQPPEPAPKQRGILVFIIDDAGNNLRDLEPFLQFPGPLTIAVLPGLPNSAEAARRIRAAGKEVFLHQPMEALGGQNPGPGAVYSGMSPEEIRARVLGNLKEIGPVAGMNNHQGSKGTMDEELMETILALCREQGIYFLDSRTTADTVAPRVARRLGIRIGERDVFLDNVPEKAEMIRSVWNGLERAEARGTAVMIGHTWSVELAATLEELYPELIARGYSLSTVSRLMMGGPRGGDAYSGD